MDKDISMGAQLEEARMWARHGYEIGQRSCLWADHGVAPKWLTEGYVDKPACVHMQDTSRLELEKRELRRLTERLVYDLERATSADCPNGDDCDNPVHIERRALIDEAREALAAA